MGKTEITYRLPTAVLVICGTVRRTLDKTVTKNKDLAKMPAVLVQKTIELRHQARDGDPRTVELKGGWFFQYKASFSQKEDGRLVKTSAESTPATADLIAAGANLAGVAVAAAAGGVALGATDKETPQRKAYRTANPTEAGERDSVLDQRKAARKKVAALAGQIIEDPSQTEVLTPQLHALRDVQRGLEQRLAALDAHYEAWLATQITTVDEDFELVVELSALPSTMAEAEKWGTPGSGPAKPDAPQNIQDLWTRFGVTVLTSWENRTGTETNQNTAEEKSKIFVCRAEPVTLAVIEKHKGEPAVVTSRARHLVADSKTPVTSYPLKRSWFGRKSLALNFSDNGYLDGVDVEGASAIGELAKSIGAVPAAVASGVDSYTKVQSGLTTARQAGLNAELGQVKAEVELRQQKVLADGLDVTTEDAARLERLKQLQAVLDAQTAIRKVDPTLVEAARGTAGGALDWYTPPAPSPKEDNTVTVILQQAPTPK